MLTTLKRILKMCGHAFTITVHERLDTIEQRSAETDNALLQASIRIAERLPQNAIYAVLDATEAVPDAAPSSAWVRLTLYLYSHVRSRKAVLMGTQPDGVAAALAATGYEVFTDSSGVGPSGSGDSGVWIAESLAPVSQLPAAGLPEVVTAETVGGFAQLAKEMRDRGYHWYLVIHGNAAPSGESFYANYAVYVQGDAGRAFFFRERETFAEAQSWCAALLKRTYFRVRTGSN